MVNKHRNEIIRKKQMFEEKTGWEDINDPSLDRASHKLRALFAVAIVFIISLFYLNHIYKIQITDHQLYTLKAEDNRIKDLKTRCKYIENLKESGNQSNFSIKECKKL